MKKSLVALLLAAGAAAFVANLALADDGGDNLGPKLMNASMAKDLQSRALRLGSSATTVDTTYVGYTPGHQSASNYWSIWSGSDKFSSPSGPYHRPPARGAMWDFEPAGVPFAASRGGDQINFTPDSLQGWWSIRNQMSGTGGLTIPDYQRPWRALDFGNIANYEFGKNDGVNTNRTFGVVGVWHIDPGNTQVIPQAVPHLDALNRSNDPNWGAAGVETDGGVKWAPLGGTHSAWMGLRRHGDNTVTDAITKNPFNEDLEAFNWFTSTSGGGSDKKYPGYAGQMDQILYRDFSVGNGSQISVQFKYQTSMSTGFSTTNTTRTGWFVHDPLVPSIGATGLQPDNPNFIQNNGSVANPPVDSLMVYVGAPATSPVILSDGNPHAIYDPLRLWFGEVIRSNEGLFKELFTTGGTNAATTSPVLTSALSNANGSMVTGGKIRVVFRVKTNFTFDDEDLVVRGYSSGGVGAAIVDDITVTVNTTPSATVTTTNFESAGDINNLAASDAAWHSTGKAPQNFHHAHFLSNGGPSATLQYQDLCGQVGNPARICDMQGVVVSAGDHGNSERSGGTFGTAEEEPFQGIISPTINLSMNPAVNTSPATANSNGFWGGENTNSTATDDYYFDYELYTGIFDFFNQGNAWRFGFQSYPGATTPTGAQIVSPAAPAQHKRWGEIRFPGFILFNPDKQCFRDLEGVKANGLLRTTSAGNLPDSCRIFLGTRQEEYRFGIPQSEWLDGAYWDNVSLDVVDGAGAAPLSADIWQFYNDTFPSDDTPGLPGTAAFDNTTALMKSGLNISPTTGNTSRFDVPGDTTVVISEGDNVRVDMIFRILPGPGNYVNPALGVNSQLRAVPSNVAPIPTPASGVSNFWSNYMFNNGAFGSGGNGTTGPGHPTAVSGALAGQKIWSPQVWNSARMDTAEVNVFQLQGRGVINPADPGLFMTAYHESELNDAHRGALGISRNVCFVADAIPPAPVTAVICGSGAVPSGTSYPPAWASGPGTGWNGLTTTKEGTKIIPDGLLTPGSHVEYFFRRQDLNLAPPNNVFLMPDTNVVDPQNDEGPSTDGHRWQEFSVLPDRWKSASYTHPVLGTVGRGAACVLYVDNNDRRGNERVWVSVADSIGATAAEKYGAHNGWHAAGDGDVNDPAFFVRKHIGQPGTTWDMYGIKASESLNTAAGSLGSRGGPSALSFNDNTNTQINGKTSRQGPSEEMLNTYYKILLVLTGDLNSSIFGPFTNKSSNDIKVMQDFLLSGSTATPTRGIFAEGDGLVEANDGTSTATFNFNTNFLGVELKNPSYLAESGNTAFTADILPTSEIDPVNPDIYGVRNACTFTLDVLDRTAGLTSETAVGSFYENVGNNGPYISGVVKHHSSTNPWIGLTDGWNMINLRSRDEISDRGRLAYYLNAFTNVFSSICTVAGSPTTGVTPGSNARIFMSLLNNPVRSGQATIQLGVTRSEKIKVQVFDVTGRLVRTVADRSFQPGQYNLVWDGADNSGNRVARGVFFVRSQYADSKFTGQSKLIVLK